MIVNSGIKWVLFVLLSACLFGHCAAARLTVIYSKPKSAGYQEIYKALKSNHRMMYGESVAYLQDLYNWNQDIEIRVTECGSIDSKYLPDEHVIVICYESLYQKVYDYPAKTQTKKAFVNRVYQNVMFTFWHEVGHAIMDQYGIGRQDDRKTLELLADEFAVLSMLWRNDGHWKDIVMISALHFKSKSTRIAKENYKVHPADDLRYEKMIVLLYGFAQKSYLRLKPEVDSLDWLSISAQEYYLERSDFWEENLRNHVRKDFFNN
ncbi:DUF4344 domain-containing metallopeptidase [Reichenbachiella sp.]